MKLTFCINTAKNERQHLELLIRSLAQNLSRKDHDFIVYVENDNQDTVGFLQTEGRKLLPNLRIIKNPLPIPLGYARNINLMFEMAQTDVVSYLQSDMVVCQNYDVEVVKHLDPNTIISSTRIEPPLHPASPEKITHNFGLDPAQFVIDDFTAFAELNKKDLLTDYWFAPFTLYKQNWIDIGGHDTLFRRSREDSDILYRFAMKGLNIKQAWNAIVYHFTCLSSRGPEWWTQKGQQRWKTQQYADLVELTRFYHKWGQFKHTTTFNPKEDYKYHISANIVRGSGWLNLVASGLKEQLSKQLSLTVSDEMAAIFFLLQHFRQIYIAEESTRKGYICEFEKFHDFANELLDISSEQWKTNKKYYHILDPNWIFPDSPIYESDIVLDCDEKNIPDLTKLKTYIRGFDTSLLRPDPGIYQMEELGNSKLIINELTNRIQKNLKVENPPLDKDIFKEL